MLTSIAFIPDGNRRFAAANNISLVKSYSMGTQKAWDVLEWLVRYPSIKVGTFYTLSLENLQRKSIELSAIYMLFGKQLRKARESTFFEEHGISLKFIGKRELLPDSLQKEIMKAEKATEKNSGRTINLAVGYNGQVEIADAARKLAEEVKAGSVEADAINPDMFKKYLYSEFQEPDLIVRTSGTQRLSGFMTYQSAYSEFYFSPKYWPEFEEADLKAAVTDFEERERRFGK